MRELQKRVEAFGGCSSFWSFCLSKLFFERLSRVAFAYISCRECSVYHLRSVCNNAGILGKFSKDCALRAL